MEARYITIELTDESLGLVVCLVVSEPQNSGSSMVEVPQAPKLKLIRRQ